MHKRAVYPGTFDPITNGHLDIIRRATQLFDEIVIGVADSQGKKPRYTLKQRVEMVQAATQDLPSVSVASFETLLVDFAKSQQASILLRGLRAVSDFEYELQLGYANSSLAPDIETVYLMPTLKHAFVSSSIVRSILEHRGNVEHLVPAAILPQLKVY